MTPGHSAPYPPDLSYSLAACGRGGPRAGIVKGTEIILQHHHSTSAEGHVFAAEEAGFHKELKPRQIQMIAIGGAIGTGLFLGAGGRLAVAGPSLVLVYALCGFFGFLVLRALGELIMHLSLIHI